MIWISKRWDADWVSSSWYGKNGGYVQWAKKYNVKQFAESILFLQQHDIHDKETLDALVDESSAKYHELMKTIKDGASIFYWEYPKVCVNLQTDVR